MKRRETSIKKILSTREEGFNVYFAGANRERGPRAPKADFNLKTASRPRRFLSKTQTVSLDQDTRVTRPNKWQLRIDQNVSHPQQSIGDKENIPDQAEPTNKPHERNGSMPVANQTSKILQNNSKINQVKRSTVNSEIHAHPKVITQEVRLIGKNYFC